MKENINYVSGYKDSTAWELISINGSRVDVSYEEYEGWEGNTFSEMHIDLKVKRKPLYMIINCVMPALILSILALVSFFLPFPQQNQLSISIILAYSVLTIKEFFVINNN